MTKTNKFWIYQFIAMGFLLMLTPSCGKDDDSNPENMVTDIDGNIYHTITIGTQTWMVENLKTTKYNDGNDIPNITDNTAWGALATPGYCWYNNDATSNKDIYGALYNWYTVNTGKLCPTGWHVPTDAEFTTLENYLIANGYNYDNSTTENKIAKALASASGWISSSDEGAVGNTDYPAIRNATGFTALPGGSRDDDDGTFGFVEGFGSWWSATDGYPTCACFWSLGYQESYSASGYPNKKNGYSVRCLKDD